MNWEKLVKIDPNNGNAWYHYGVCLFRLNKTDESKAAFDKAKELGVQD